MQSVHTAMLEPNGYGHTPAQRVASILWAGYSLTVRTQAPKIRIHVSDVIAKSLSAKPEK